MSRRLTSSAMLRRLTSFALLASAAAQTNTAVAKMRGARVGTDDAIAGTVTFEQSTADPLGAGGVALCGEDGTAVCVANQPSGHDGSWELWFGNDANDNAGRPFKGLIDDVKIYNRTLTGAEVAAIAGQGASATPAPSLPPSTTA